MQQLVISVIAGPAVISNSEMVGKEVYMSIWACRAGPARARLSTARFHRAQARHGETSCHAGPARRAGFPAQARHG